MEYREIIKVYSFDNQLKYTFTLQQANAYFKRLRATQSLISNEEPIRKKKKKKSKTKSEKFKELIKKKS